MSPGAVGCVVGKSASGDVVCYWWSAADGWGAQSISEAGGGVPAIVGDVSFFVAPSGERHISAADAARRVIDISSKPDALDWRWQDLTALAMT